MIPTKHVLLGLVVLSTLATAPSHNDAAAKPKPRPMVEVPEGPFIMGASSGGAMDERPEHEVYLSAFWIDVYEVTAADYRRCVRARACTKPYSEKNSAYNWGVPGREQHPISGVTWEQAKAYCNWEGKRLPTEAQWEKAARGTDGRTFPWGEEAPSCQLAVMNDGCGEKGTWPVGSKPSGASPYGVHDMSGNVWEWTADVYDRTYYTRSAKRDPAGPPAPVDNPYIYERVGRGGSWMGGHNLMRSANRIACSGPSAIFDSVGFRCAR